MTTPTYRQVPAQVDLPALEHAVLDFWREQKIFAKSLEQSEGRPEWVFYEGPPTANGMPGAHHIEARVFKDVFPRFRTMRGYHVARKAGWDCHGLPVELAVEKELGFNGKKDIEAYGIAEFNAKCRESVTRHTDAFDELTTRMGYWVDLDDAYRTMDPEYIESVWWSLKEIFDKGLLVQDHRVAPWCPRCGTGLSDHELAQGYETVVDPSVYVRFPLTSGPLAGEAALAGLDDDALDAGLQHRRRRPPRRHLRRRDERRRRSSSSPSRCSTRRSARAGRRPARPSPAPRWSAGPINVRSSWSSSRATAAHYVVNADYVTTEDGTGLVHQSPAFGEDDLKVCRAYGLPVVNPVRPDGTFEEDVPLVGGVFFKKADEALTEDLEQRGLLFRHIPYEHSYPHCWRCHTALLYYAQPSWYIRTTAVKDRLLQENEKTNWFPDSVKHGRFGDWLNNNIDWALSRNRYWGTPLPIWRCEDDHLTCRRLPRRADRADRHRPVAASTRTARSSTRSPSPAPRATAGGRPRASRRSSTPGTTRVRCRSRSGATRTRTRSSSRRRYPAQFICEAIDQTRGWFYTLMAVGTLVFDKSSLRERGLPRPHPRRGRPQDVQAPGQHPGADPADGPARRRRGALVHGGRRLPVGGPPRRPRHHPGGRPQDAPHVLEHGRLPGPVRPYVRAGRPSAADPAPADRPVLDRWLLCELHALIDQVTAGAGGATTPSAPASCCRRSSTTCPTGTYAAPAAASGRATRPRCAPCTRSSRRSPG